MEVTVDTETGLSTSLTDAPGVTGAAGGCDSDGKRWPKERQPLAVRVGLDAELACDECSWEASWSRRFSSSATRVVFWTFFARGGAGVWLPQGLLSLWQLLRRGFFSSRCGWRPETGLGETYRSHLEIDGPGMHLDLAFAQVTQARGPLLADSESAIFEVRSTCPVLALFDTWIVRADVTV